MIVLALSSVCALAQEKEAPTYPVVKVSGVLFPVYAVNLTDGAELANAFAIDRAYLRADAKVSERVSTRITLDADHVKPLELPTGESVTFDTKYRLFLKHAYVEVKDLGPIRLRAGMVPTPYTQWFDETWGNRYIAESFARNAGVLQTADLGVSAFATHGGGLVDWNVSVLNGEGYSKLEVDAGKMVQARVAVDPLAKLENRSLPIVGFASYSGNPSTGGEPTLNWGGGLGFDMPRLFVWAEVLGTATGDDAGFGYSASLNPRLPKYLGIIARYEHWDADTRSSGDGENHLVAGLDKDFLERVSLAVLYERDWVDGTPDAASHGVVLRGQAGF